MNIPIKTKTRFVEGIKKFQKILERGKLTDINESDTVTIISDILCEVFGYDKYSEITSEYIIKKTFCDLAIVLEDKPKLLIECKAIGLDLKDDFVRQATNYSANSGIEWVILTNGIEWKIYKVIFNKPIEKDLVFTINFLELSTKKSSDLELLYPLCREALSNKNKNSLEELHKEKEIMNKFVVGQIIQTDLVLDSIRRQIKKMSSDIKITNEDLKEFVAKEVLKREVVDSDEAILAQKKIKKMEKEKIKNQIKQIEEVL